jgi:spermidine synthase
MNPGPEALMNSIEVTPNLRAGVKRATRVLGCACLALLAACSALEPRVLHERPSMFGTLAVTEELDGTRALRFGRSGVTQTVVRPGDPDYLHFAYARLALAGLAVVPEARRILVVGLGGGSMPMYLHRHFPRVHVDVVDTDPAVVAVAREYFGYREDARLATHVGDGRAFIEHAAAGQYDIVILDAYGSESVPVHLATQEFLGAVRRVLADDGVVVANLWNGTYNRLYRPMLQTYADAFTEIHVLDTRREVNHVVLALSRKRGLNAQSIADLARQLAVLHDFGFDLGAAVGAAHIDAAVGPGQGVNLRDGDANR